MNEFSGDVDVGQGINDSILMMSQLPQGQWRLNFIEQLTMLYNFVLLLVN